METKIEYRVRPVTRYVVTRFEGEYDPTGRRGSSGQSTTCGEFETFDTGYAVGYALCKAEHDRLGYPLGDERIQYPERVAQPASGQQFGSVGSGRLTEAHRLAQEAVIAQLAD